MKLEMSAIIFLLIMIVLFVPFYPFRMVKRLAFFLLNKFVPLKFKFDDIGGVPIMGMRLFNVRIQLRGKSTLEARELRLRINLWRMLFLSRPTIEPITLIDPKIVLYQEKERGEMWFLLPLSFAKKVVGFMFANLWGLNKVRIRNGEIEMHGSKDGVTTIHQLNGLFLSKGGNACIRNMSCMIGTGTIEMSPLTTDIEGDINVKVRNLLLEDLGAMKLPKNIAGAIDVNATLSGGFSPPTLDGDIHSPVIYLREQPIRNFRSPLHFEGVTLALSDMAGEVADYLVKGSLENDVDTDQVRLKLHGKGEGRGPGLIFKMLNMKPYIESAQIEAKVDLAGDFDIFSDITGEVKVHLKEARINPDAFSSAAKPGRVLPKIPVLNLDMFMQEGSLYTESIEVILPGAKINLSGRIDMTLDLALDKVTDTVYDLSASVRNDSTYAHGADAAISLSIPAEFDGRLKLSTSSTTDPADFLATGSVEIKNLLISSGGQLGWLSRFSDLMEVFFHGIKGDIELNSKRARLKQVHVDAVWLYLILNGDIGYDGALDIHADTKILSPRDEPAHGGKSLLRLPMKFLSNLKTGFHISGAVTKPKFKLTGRDHF